MLEIKLERKMYEDGIDEDELRECFDMLYENQIIEGDEPGCCCLIVGDTPFYFYKDILVSEWLYETPADELTIGDYLSCEDCEDKIAFVLKVGRIKLAKLIKEGLDITEIITRLSNSHNIERQELAKALEKLN